MVNRTERSNTRDTHARRETAPNTYLYAKFGTSDNASNEVIASLVNAPENRRARQVSEWERIGRQTFRAAAS